MARNLKRENIKKLLAVQTENGFKVDVANYVYNPGRNHEYPNLHKVVSETDTDITYVSVRYFKYYDGTGAYEVEKQTFPKESGEWRIAHQTMQPVEIEQSNRFSLKRLIELAETNEIVKGIA